MKTFFCSALIVLLSQPLFSCMNEMEPDPQQEILTFLLQPITPHEGSSYLPEVNYYPPEQLQRQLIEIEQKLTVQDNFTLHNNKGVVLIRMGRLEESITHFQQLRDRFGEEYSYNANLGTAFERAGMVDSAYVYISKALEINPRSHDDSEWIHLNILKAKLKLRDHPEWLNNNSIIGVRFGTDDLPQAGNNMDLKELDRQLRTQLAERLAAVGDHDPVVGQLLFDLGNITYLLGSAEGASANYRRAQAFGYHPPILNRRIEAMQPEVQSERELRYQLTHVEHPMATLAMFGLILMTFLLSPLIALVRNRMATHRKSHLTTM